MKKTVFLDNYSFFLLTYYIFNKSFFGGKHEIQKNIIKIKW